MYQDLRKEMVEFQIRERGISDKRVLQAMESIERERFAPLSLGSQVYHDAPQPIGESQTISQPYIVALMTQALELKPEDIALEIGTGSGYQTALLGLIAREVYTVERLETLSQQAQKTLNELQYHNIRFKVGNGFDGWREFAPFDVIIVTCAPESIPHALEDQLADGGRMVIPVGESGYQTLYLVRRTEKGLTKEEIAAVRFVPMVDK